MKKLLLFLLSLFMSQLVLSDPVVISTIEITRQEAINILNFRQFEFSDATRIKMITLPSDNFTTKELAIILGTTPTRFHERAESAFATGKLNMYKVVNTEKDVVRTVIQTPGSIGYAQDYIITSYGRIPTVIRIR